jgi:excisionase family DNA binding protein
VNIRKAITATQAAKQLGVHRETVRRDIKRGKLRAVKPGGEYLLDPAQLEGYTPGKPGRPRKVAAP